MYTLINAKERHIKNPTTFLIPSDEDINNLEIGSFVKLGFCEKDLAPERMWVQIIEIHGDRYKGTLGNQPLSIQSIKYKEIVSFTSANIMALYD